MKRLGLASTENDYLPRGLKGAARFDLSGRRAYLSCAVGLASLRSVATGFCDNRVDRVPDEAFSPLPTTSFSIWG